MCQRDEGFEFVVPLLLRCDARRADALVLEKALRVRGARHAVESELARRWLVVFGAESYDGVVRELELTHRLLGVPDVEARIDEWSRFGRSFGAFTRAKFGAASTVEPSFARAWVTDGLMRSFSR